MVRFLLPAFLGSLTLVACVDTSSPLDEANGIGGANEGGSGEGDLPADEARSCGQLAPMGERVVLAYLPTWSDIAALTATMNFETLTHVAVAFANPVEGGPIGFAYTDERDVEALVERAHENGVKVLASIAGAAESDVVRARIGPDEVDAYVEELAVFVDRFGFDGVDVDIEGGSVDATYAPFVTKLALRIRPEGKLVTSAVASWFAGAITDEALFCFDFINVMSYDLLPWEGGAAQPGDHASMEDAKDDLRYWTLTRGYPAERTVLGVPFYGYCWGTGCEGNPGGGQIRYSAIAERFPGATNVDWYEDPAADVRLSLNSPATIAEKTRYAQDFGGVMIWDISQDTPTEELFGALESGL